VALFLSLEHLELRYEPFPIGLARPAIAPETYDAMAEAFPSVELFEDFRAMGKPGNKYTLSERENLRAYLDFVRSRPLWREFHRQVKSQAFIQGVLEALRQRYVDLGFRPTTAWQRMRSRLGDLIRGRVSPQSLRLRSRFEFSALPADGGQVVPHTDSVSKIVTLVCSMARKGEWDPAWGGGLDLNRPRHPRLAFNQLNRLADFDEMEVIDTYPYEPNQCVVFVKTWNSWHSVRPMTGPGSNALRKTLTIVIETPR